MKLRLSRGLDSAASLEDHGEDGNAGKLDLGLSASMALGARAYLDYSHSIKKGWGDLSAYATAFAGVSKVGGSWQRDAGATAGLRLRW